jgi:Uma2 family endonuclease
MQTIVQPPLVYPSSDGKSMADNTKQFNWITLIKGNLEILYAQDPNVFVAGDLLWYPVEGEPKIAAAPDVMVVFGRPRGDRKSYIQHQEAGVAPQVVFEILSDANTPMEMLRKTNFYSVHSVEEYYLYDPERDDLEVYLRRGDTLRMVDPLGFPFVSPRMQVKFDKLGNELALWHPNGRKFESLIETSQRAENAERQAQHLADKLRELGIDPSAILNE